MAIVICSECGKEVSSKADKCMGCGNPIFAKIEKGASGEAIHTTQKTGKKLKMHRVISLTILVIGLFMVWGQTSNPIEEQDFTLSITLVVLGSIWFYTTRIRTWWNHA